MTYYFRRSEYNQYEELSFEEKMKSIDDKLNTLLLDYKNFTEKIKNMNSIHEKFLNTNLNINSDKSKIKTYVKKHEQESILGKRKHDEFLEEDTTEKVYDFIIYRKNYSIDDLIIEYLTEDNELNKKISETYLWCLEYQNKKYNK